MTQRHSDDPLQRHVEPGHETRDANIKWVLIAGGGLMLLIVGTMFLMKITFDYFDRQDRQMDSPRPPLADTRVKASGPLLQHNPYGELKAYRASEDQILHGYWRHYAGDTPLGSVSIPIERAMDLVIERGLLSSPANPPTTTAPAPRGPQTQPER